MTERVNYVLLFEGRTGSSYVMSCLESHPNVIATGEALANKSAVEQHKWVDEFFKNGGESPSAGMKEKVKRLIGKGSKQEIMACGFKTKLREFTDPEDFKNLLDKHDCKIVYLDRKNIIKQALSGLNVERLYQKYGTYNLKKGQAPLEPFAPTIEEFEEAIRFKLEKNKQLDDYIQQLSRPMIKLYYEEILEDHDTFFAKLLDFLEVPARPMESKFVKNTKDDMREVLLNYDEIKQHFSDKGYAELFA